MFNTVAEIEKTSERRRKDMDDVDGTSSATSLPRSDVAFQLVKNKRKIEKPKDRKRNDVKVVGSSESIESTNDSVGFSAVTKRAWLHISRMKPEVDCEHIRRHLCQKFPGEEFIIDRIQGIEKASSIAFRVGADFKLLDDLNRPETWPIGVIVKRFRFLRRYDEKI